MTARHVGWVALIAGLLALAASYVVALLDGPDTRFAEWLAAIAVPAALAGTLAIGARRGDTLSRAAGVAVAALFLIPLGGFVAALVLPPEGSGAGLWLGLPPRAAVILLGIGILPVLVLPLAYAREHARDALDPAALEALRAEAARLRSGESR